MIPEVWPQPFTVSPIERTPPQYVPMPPPFEASHTFSVQVLDDAVEIVLDRIQEAGNRQAALGAAIGKDGCRGHEPQLRHVVVEPLRMRGIVGIGARDAREQVLRGFAGEQIAIDEGGAAEIREQRVARRVDVHVDRCARGLRRIRAGCRRRGAQDLLGGFVRAARELRAGGRDRLTCHSAAPFVRGAEAARDSADGRKHRRCCRNTPSDQKFQVCSAGLLAHRSIAIVRPSRSLRLQWTFPKNRAGKSQFACGLQLRGQLRIGEH